MFVLNLIKFNTKNDELKQGVQRMMVIVVTFFVGIFQIIFALSLLYLN